MFKISESLIGRLNAMNSRLELEKEEGLLEQKRLNRIIEQGKVVVFAIETEEELARYFYLRHYPDYLTSEGTRPLVDIENLAVKLTKTYCGDLPIKVNRAMIINILSQYHDEEEYVEITDLLLNDELSAEEKRLVNTIKGEVETD